tara:strand:+ start:29157 stop:30131 length:975 start_codon:yes stop_codon:yes gene_type:complete
VFSTQAFEIPFFEEAFRKTSFDLHFIDGVLDCTSVDSAQGSIGVVVFVNDQLDASVLARLKELGIEWVALRCAGFNNVDVDAAKTLGLSVVHVPAYSPTAVAEFTLGLILALLRNIPQAYRRTKDLNFSLDGLLGEGLSGKSVGVIGTGKIGTRLVDLLAGFDCQILAFDINKNRDLINKVNYVGLEELLRKSQIVSLNVPLNDKTFHLINEASLQLMPKGSFLVNTGRGGLIHTEALVQALKSKHLAGAALDVYEQETGVFFKDHSSYGIEDDLLARLTTFPNVIVTSHQAFLSKEALQQIAEVTAANLIALAHGSEIQNSVY